MKPEHELYLHEEIMLLALEDKDGTVELGSRDHLALGGAILAELLMGGRIWVEEERQKRFARAVKATPFDEPLLDDCLQRIQACSKRQQLQTWVSRFAHIKDLKHRVARRLCQRGILRESEDKVLLIFKRKIYPEIDPGPERRLLSRLQQAIFSHNSVDPRTTVLIALAQQVDLLKYVCDRKQLKKRQQRIARIVAGNRAGAATKEAVEAVQAMEAVTAIMPSVFATTN